MLSYKFKILGLYLLCTTLWSCQDKCTQIRKYRTTEPVITSLKDLRNAIASTSTKPLENPGKIYIKDQYLFINEIKKGIHIIDNSNPSSPRFVSFINIPGNIDMAVADNILYADSYTDVVAIDISQPTNVKELSREQRVFQNGQVDGIGWFYNETEKTIVDYKWVTKTDTVEVYCEGGVYPQINYRGGEFYDAAVLSKAYSTSGPTAAPGATSSGTGGSMARFTIVGNYLYAVSQNDLIPFDISQPQKPILLQRQNLNWGIETIFPYKDKLFIGSNTGMQIYDNSNPAKPRWLSTYNHFKACDPVVVFDNYAYVTLRATTSFGRCGIVNNNQLDLIDIADPEYPKLVKSFDMKGPAGLGIAYPNLFLCEGKDGLKVFDIADPLNLDKKKLAEFTGFEAYDVIPLKNVLLLIGKDGLYQFDYSNINNIKQLSVIKANPKTT
jgi:hypothetical protein